MSQADLVGAAVLGALFAGLIVAAELWRRLGEAKAEWTRKLVHIGGGIVCLLFPFLVRSPWVVLAMAVALSGVFALAAKTDLLPGLHGVERKSRGVEYYPLAVFMIFFLTQGRPWLYLAAMLVLAIGDAFAALIGSRYGSIRYEVESGEKSLEGSAIFLVIAFLAMHLPMLLLTDLPRPICVLAALLVAILVTGFEAISLEGADNLFVPLAVVFVLGKITTKPFSEVLFQNASLVVICIVIGVLVWRYPLFNTGAAIAVMLFAYGTWSLGSWEWALPVLFGVAVYLIVGHRLARAAPPRFRVRVVARALIPVFLILVVANALDRYDLLFGPYLATCGAVLSFAFARRVLAVRALRLTTRLGTVALLSAAASAMTSLFPWLVEANPSPALLIAQVGAVFAVTWSLVVWEKRRPARPVEDWGASRFLLSLAAGLLILGLQAASVIPSWHPAP